MTLFQSANFDLEFGPDYYPAFEVRLPTTTEEVTLMVKDQREMVVWEHDVDLTGKTSSCALAISVAGGIMFSVVRLSVSCSCKSNTSNAMRQFIQIWHNHPLGLKDELIYIVLIKVFSQLFTQIDIMG